MNTTAAKRAVIVGNSDGIGLALTRRLLPAGWTVTGLSRSDSPVTDERYVHRVVDVTAAGYPAVLTEAADAMGGLDLCVYAAGVGEFLDLTDLSPQTRMLQVNLIGAARTLEVVVPRMIAAGSGHIVGVSSLADVLISAEAAGYAASKAAMSTYLSGLALALRPHNVAVTTVRFGFVDTKLAKAPKKPMMVSADKAAGVLMEALRTRPTVVSYPRTMAVGASLLRAVNVARLPRRTPNRPISKDA